MVLWLVGVCIGIGMGWCGGEFVVFCCCVFVWEVVVCVVG